MAISKTAAADNQYIGIILFFTNGIELNEKRWFAMAFMALVFILQLLIIYNIWQKRIARLKLNIQDFEDR